MKTLLCFLALSVGALGQTAFRADPTFVYTTPGNTPPGANAPVYAIPGSTIAVYTTQTANVLATTYTSGLASAACPVNAQVTLAGSAVCRSTSGNVGAFGFWLLPGQYWYTVTIGSITSIPYPLTVGGSGSGGSTSFSAITPGTNVNGAMLLGSGSSIAPLSGGVVSANQLNGVALSGLSTGILKITNGTGAPSTAAFGDVVNLFSGCSGVLYLGADGACHAALTSVFGRTGVVIATNGDYTASQVTNVPAGGIASITVQAAINELDSEKGTVSVVGAGTLASTECVTGGGAQAVQTPSVNCTVDSSGNMAVKSLTVGTGPALTPGTGGALACPEGTAPSVGPAAGVDVLYCDSTAHTLLLSRNNGSYFPLGQVVFEGTLALGTGAISSATCATAVTVTATGLATTDVVTASFNGDPTAVTGYVPLTSGMLAVILFPTANTINARVCNSTSSSITPGAITLNVMAVRK